MLALSKSKSTSAARSILISFDGHLGIQLLERPLEPECLAGSGNSASSRAAQALDRHAFEGQELRQEEVDAFHRVRRRLEAEADERGLAPVEDEAAAVHLDGERLTLEVALAVLEKGISALGDRVKEEDVLVLENTG